MNHDQKEHRAVALTYHNEVPAPFVVARGKGQLARRLEELAREYGIPVVSDSSLTESLIVLDVGEVIPEELYHIVAQLFAFIYRASNDRESK